MRLNCTINQFIFTTTRICDFVSKHIFWQFILSDCRFGLYKDNEQYIKMNTCMAIYFHILLLSSHNKSIVKINWVSTAQLQNFKLIFQALRENLFVVLIKQNILNTAIVKFSSYV